MASFLAPAMSPNQYNESGFLTFKYQNRDLTDAELIFQKVSQTYGMPSDKIDLPVFRVNFAAKYGLQSISSVDQVQSLHQRLHQSQALTLTWLSNLVGTEDDP